MWIEIDGPNGVGKTTQCVLLQKWLMEEGFSCEIVKEISAEGNFIGKLIKDSDLNNCSYLCQMFAILACKSFVIEKNVLPYSNLSNDSIVITDRGILSFILYHYKKLKIEDLKLFDMASLAMGGCFPDVIFYLDASNETIKNRILNKGVLSRFDKIELDTIGEERALVKEIFQKRLVSNLIFVSAESFKSMTLRIRRCVDKFILC